MADLAPAVTPASLLTSPAVQSAAEMAKRGDIKKTAQKFESSFLSIMLQQMFEGTETSAPFGGGPGESMFKSFMTEAMANKMAKAGGIGVAPAIEHEMLKLQGLT